MSTTAILPFPLLPSLAGSASEPVPSGVPAMAILPDRALLERVAGGDTDAFTALYRRYERPVFGVLLRLAGRTARARRGVAAGGLHAGVARGRRRTTRPGARSGPGSTRSPSTPRAASSPASATAPPTSRSTRPGWTCPTSGRARSASRRAWTRPGGRRPSRSRCGSCRTSCARWWSSAAAASSSFAEIAEVTGRAAGDAEVALPPGGGGAARGARPGAEGGAR